MQYKFTQYFEKEVLRKRPYIKKEWCIEVLEKPIRVEKKHETKLLSGNGLLIHWPC